MPELWTDATGAAPPHLLHNFALKGCHAELSQLLQLGAARWPTGGFSPLHAACSNGHAECVRVLLAAGAPVEVRLARRDRAHDRRAHRRFRVRPHARRRRRED